MNRTATRNLLSGTILSVLIFFSISFLTILVKISPMHYYHRGEDYRFSIGFPFTYYYQMLLNGDAHPQFGWSVPDLIYDCAITWLVVTGVYVLTKRSRAPFAR